MVSTIFHRQRHSIDCDCALCAIGRQAQALLGAEVHTPLMVGDKDFQVIVACLKFVERCQVTGVTREEVEQARQNLQRQKLKAIEAEIARTSEYLDVPAFLRRQAD
jgi:hypothetical protein